MLHTVEITHRLSAARLRNIAGNMFDTADINSLLRGEVTTLAIPDYHFFGVNEANIYAAGEQYIVKMVINPQSMILQENTITLFDCSAQSLQQLTAAFADTLDRIGLLGTGSLVTITEWFAARVDYAVDLQTENVPRYVALAKMERRPARFSDLVDLPGSAYPECRSVTLNFYDKASQVENELSGVPNYEQMVDSANNVFRIEVQCESAKLKALVKRHGLPNMRLGSFINPVVAMDTVNYYYCYLMGTADFYSMAAARRMVEQQPWRADRRQRFIQWLEFVAAHETFAEAQQSFIDAHSRATLYNYLKLSREAGVNPVTIPDSWGIDHLPNPWPSSEGV